MLRTIRLYQNLGNLVECKAWKDYFSPEGEKHYLWGKSKAERPCSQQKAWEWRWWRGNSQTRGTPRGPLLGTLCFLVSDINRSKPMSKARARVPVHPGTRRRTEARCGSRVGRNTAVQQRCFLPVAAVCLFSLDSEPVGGVPLPWAKTPWAIYTHPAKYLQILHWETKGTVEQLQVGDKFPLRNGLSSQNAWHRDQQTPAPRQNSNFDRPKGT